MPDRDRLQFDARSGRWVVSRPDAGTGRSRRIYLPRDARTEDEAREYLRREADERRYRRAGGGPN